VALIAVVALELLLFGFESAEFELAFATFVMTVPFGVEGDTATMIRNSALCPFPRVLTPQVTVPPGGYVLFGPMGGGLQVPLGPLACATETKVSKFDRASVKIASTAVSGPLFNNTMSYPIVPPAFPVAGALFITVTSADETVSVVADVSFSESGSLSLVSVALFVYVAPDPVPLGMCATNWNVAVDPAGNV
jgi:hypothetical protein